jgi:hypothetical protein
MLADTDANNNGDPTPPVSTKTQLEKNFQKEFPSYRFQSLSYV